METHKIVCPKCNSINSVNFTNDITSLLCTQCQKPLNNRSPQEVSDESCIINLQENDIPVLIDFYSPTCVPCMEMSDDYEGAAYGYSLKVKFLKINTNLFQEVAKKYNIKSLPTIVAFKNNEEISRISGVLSQYEISKLAKSLI